MSNASCNLLLREIFVAVTLLTLLALQLCACGVPSDIVSKNIATPTPNGTTSALFSPACTVSADDFQAPVGTLSVPPHVAGISGQAVTASGTKTVVQLLQAAQPAFDQVNGTLTHFSTTASGEGILDLISRKVQIAATSYSYKEADATKTFFNLHGVPVGVVPSTLLIGQGLRGKINNLTLRQIVDIYQGKFTNWRELGGPDQPIVAIARSDATTGDTISGTTITFSRYVLRGASINRSFVKSYTGIGDMVQALSTDFPYGIAFAATSELLDKSTRSKVFPICIDNASATLNNINKGTYPFWNLALIYTWGIPDTKTAQGRAVQAWLNYLISPDFQNKNVPQAGLYPIGMLTASALHQRPAA